MQSVGFNASPFSFQLKNAVPFAAQANTPVLQQALQSDEVLFGSGRGRIEKAVRGGLTTGGGGKPPPRSNQKEPGKTHLKQTRGKKHQEKKRRQEKFLLANVPADKKSLGAAAKEGKSGGQQRIQAAIDALLPHLTPEQKGDFDRITGSPPPESKANPPQLPAAPQPQPIYRQVMDGRFPAGNRVTYPLLPNGQADLNSPLQHPSARKADQIHQNLEGPGVTPRLSYSQPYWQAYNP